MKIEPCVRCGRALRRAETFNETADPAVVTYSLLKTQGVRPRVTAAARRRVFCMPCGVSLGLGPVPENGAFSEDVHAGLVELLGKCPDLASLACEQKINPPARPKLMPGSQPDKHLTPALLKEPVFPASA